MEDLKGSESWRIFRIISEFTEGFDKLETLPFSITIFGAARSLPPNRVQRCRTGWSPSLSPSPNLASVSAVII